MAFLAAQLVLTIVVLLFTIFATHRSRMQVLKGKSLATMCALSDNVKTQLGGMDDMKQLTERAKRQRVRLALDADGAVRGLDAPPQTSTSFGTTSRS